MISEYISLYLHIPFCRHRCSYCDFNTYTSLGTLQSTYASALADEIRQVGQQADLGVRTLFFGGGTPSLMSVEDLDQILTAVRHAFLVAPDCEISMEANPGTVDLLYLQAIKNLGINRLSFGVQSVVMSELALLEREHDFETVVDAVEMSRAAGLNNFNLDLIYGVPGQTLSSWEKSVRELLKLHPPHLSLYCLTIEPGTPMQRWLMNGRIQPPDPDLAADQYKLACTLLANEGYTHYEISNWAKPGFECAHNLTYWRNQTYLGMGAGAHGHANGLRYEVVKQPRVYIRRMESAPRSAFPLSSAVAQYHQLSQKEKMSDTIMTQLRLLHEGLDLIKFEQQFGQSLTEAYPEVLPQLLDWALVKTENERLLLTENGRFLSNQVFYRFM